jgi:hypothetical protein
MPFVPDEPSSGGRFVPDSPASAPPARSDGFFGNLAGGVLEPLAAMGTGMIARPVSQIAGLAAMGREAFPGAPQGDPQAFQQDVQRSLTYEPRTAAGQSQMNPLNFIPQLLGQLIGAGAHGAGNFIAPPGSEPGREAVGRGVTEAVEQAPGFLGVKGAKAGEAVAPAMRAGSEKLMASALKPPGSLQKTGKGDRAVSTMLDYDSGGMLPGFNVSEAGATRMRDLVSDLNSEIAQTIATSDKTVNKAQAASRGIIPEMDRELHTATPDLGTIRDIWERFLDHPLTAGQSEIPIQLAQSIKQGEMKKLGDTAYGQLGTTETQTRKGLVRGLKEKIAEEEPSVSALNAKESELLTALSPLEKRVYNEAKNNPAGLGILSHTVPGFIAWMADRSGAFKSLLGRVLNQAGKSAPGSGEYAAPALGLAVGQQAQGAPSGPPPQ